MKPDYYLRKYIEFLLLEQAKNRECAILPLMRGAKISSLSEFESLLNLVNWDKKKSNFYISCARISKIPNFSYNLHQRSQFTREWFQNDLADSIYSYDLFIDFDNSYKDKDGNKVTGKIEEIMEEVKKLKAYLDDYKVPYQILFSGNKGFHVVIDGDYLEIDKIESGNVYPHKTIGENIKEMLNLKFMDLANNGTIARLRKLGYSLVMPSKFEGQEELTNERLMNVVLPLSDEDFNNFKVENVILANVLKIPLLRRGKLERFEELDISEKKQNLKNFIDVFNFK